MVFGALVFKLSVWCEAEGYASGLRAAAASNKICNKNHLLHLVGILFLHINDNARSKSLQMEVTIVLTQCMYVFFCGSDSKVINSLNEVNQLVFVMERSAFHLIRTD